MAPTSSELQLKSEYPIIYVSFGTFVVFSFGMIRFHFAAIWMMLNGELTNEGRSTWKEKEERERKQDLFHIHLSISQKPLGKFYDNLWIILILNILNSFQTP